MGANEDLRIDTFRNRLELAMASENKRPVDLCEETGIVKSAISQYLAGKNVPKTDKVYLIAKALNVDEAWLMGYDVPMRKSKISFNEEVAKIDIELLTYFHRLPEEKQSLAIQIIKSML